MSKTLWSAALAAAALAALSATPAQASMYDTRSVVVQYGDLDLSREPGAKALLSRIKAAANYVCGTEPFILEITQREAYVACRDDSVGRAVVEVDAPMLTEVYLRGGGRIGVVTIQEVPSSPPPPYQGPPPGAYQGPPPAQPGNITMDPIPNP